MLRETEWLTLNNILLGIYMVDGMEALTKKVMNGVRLMIPYSSGYFALFDEEQNIIWDSICLIGISREKFKRYVDESYTEEYIKYLYDFSTKTPIYHDTSVLMDNIRQFTPFYANFLEPSGCFYGAGILFIRNNRIIGILELFRNKKVADFTERDIYVFNVLKEHIENIISKMMQKSQSGALDEKRFLSMKIRYELTDREDEILRLLSSSASNQNIADQLIISASTVKKHIYNIYSKTGVKNRTQLLNLLYSL